MWRGVRRGVWRAACGARGVRGAACGAWCAACGRGAACGAWCAEWIRSAEWRGERRNAWHCSRRPRDDHLTRTTWTRDFYQSLTGGQPLDLEYALPQESRYETTLLSESLPRYWELELTSDVAGVDYLVTFLIPIYARASPMG